MSTRTTNRFVKQNLNYKKEKGTKKIFEAGQKTSGSTERDHFPFCRAMMKTVYKLTRNKWIGGGARENDGVND